MPVEAWHCRLATGVRSRRVAGRAFVVSDRPLTVLEVRDRGLRLLRRLRPGRDVVLDELPPADLRFLRRLAELRLLDLRPATNGAWPAVSVVVPARGRPAALAACLASLGRVRYPAGCLDVLVVDDGSDPPVRVPDGVRLVRLPESLGPGAARNAGAREGRGELIAFIDSDCVAEPAWLERLVPELADPDVAAAGGRVLGVRDATWLERYEAARSPLDLGTARASARPQEPVPYLVTANVVVRRAAFEAVGGFDESLRCGEDVDLSWRLSAAGHRLVYRPSARVGHRHRGRIREFTQTRARYAASEAALLRRHPDAGRWLGFSPGMAAVALGAVGALTRRRRLLAAAAVVMGFEVATTAHRLTALGVSPHRSVPALLRGQVGGLYHAARQLTRYYGLPAALLALASGRTRWRLLAGLALAELAPAAADWWRLRPRLELPLFLLAHALDDLSYQTGVLLGCLRERTLAPLRVELRGADGRRRAE
jgi:mycofactocin system glycosyltransferase